MEINIKETLLDEGKKRMMALEISDNLYQKIRKEAFDREVSISAMVRFIIDKHYLEKEE